MTFYSKRLYLLLIPFFVTILDQATKYLVRKHIPFGLDIRLFDNDLVWLQHVTNPGMVFGIRLFPPSTLIVITIIAIIGMILYIFFSPDLPKNQSIPLSLILGGAIGNLIDRIAFGQVTDFISVDLPDAIMLRWPTFNVADSSVSIGVTLLLIFSLWDAAKQKKYENDGIASDKVQKEG